MGIACFLVTPTDEQESWLRRYADGPCPATPGEFSYHNAETHIGRLPVTKTADGYIESVDPSGFAGDARWPAACACGYEFTETDTWQVMGRQLWEHDGERRILDDIGDGTTDVLVWGAGAMWDAWWIGRKGSDGHAYAVKVPGDRTWTIDSEASNCTRPGEDHDCWCRHGEAPLITVDKVPEPGRSTCAAGAGSILAGDYHGFLRSGELVAT